MPEQLKREGGQGSGNPGNAGNPGVARLVAVTEHLQETTRESNILLRELRDAIKELCIEVAVLQEWRRAHGEQHVDYDKRRKRDDFIDRTVTAVGITIAAILGIRDG